MITLSERIHLRAGEAIGSVTLQLLLHIVIGVVNHLLHTNQIRLLSQNHIPANLPAILPLPGSILIRIQAGNPYVTGHYAMRTLLLRFAHQLRPGYRSCQGQCQCYTDKFLYDVHNFSLLSKPHSHGDPHGPLRH